MDYNTDGHGFSMQVRESNIESKHRRDVGFVACLDNFTVLGGNEVTASSIVDNTAVSLYCFDDVNRQAVFIELPEQVERW